MQLFGYACLMLIFGGFFSLFFQPKWKLPILLIFAAGATAVIGYLDLSVLLSGKIILGSFEASYPINTISFALDPLSAFMSLIIAVGSMIGLLYAVGYLNAGHPHKSWDSHGVLLSIFIAAMQSVLVVQNALVFLMVWEVMSVSSFFLVVFNNQQKEVIDAGLTYFIFMHIGLVFLIIGFVLLSVFSGGLGMDGFSTVFYQHHWLGIGIFGLLLVGFGMKAGLIPMHTWLPPTYSSAPIHISALMSGVMVNMGFFGILRIITVIPSPSLLMIYILLAVSTLSAVWGVIYSISQKNIKKLLAYSSIENMGLIGIGISIGLFGQYFNKPAMAVLGFSGALLHILNHTLFKSLLFQCVGLIYLKTRELNMEKLGGLIHRMPNAAVYMLIGSVAIIGLPPLNGFISEFLIYLGILYSFKITYPISFLISVTLILTMAFVGVIAMMAFSKLYSTVFLGSPRTIVADHEAGSRLDQFAMQTAMGLNMGFVIGIGLFPLLVFKLIRYPIMTMTHGIYNPRYLHLLNQISIVWVAFILFLGVLCGIRFLLFRRSVSIQPTWGCAYAEPSLQMQYTGTSYVEPFLELVHPILHQHVTARKPLGLFPTHARLHTQIKDMIDIKVILPIKRIILGFFGLFSWIQSGILQQYIVYELVFLLGGILYVLGAYLR